MEKQDEQSLLQVLYDKNYECPVCDKHFTSKSIRSGRNKLISTDEDLYSHFDIINPIIYDVIACTQCGYAALSKVFTKLRPSQIQWIKDEVKSKYTPTFYPEILTEEIAINRYKLALLSANVKKAKAGEVAYLCLKIGWLYRSLEDLENENLFLEHAKRNFLKAFTTERFPIFELNEMTTMYIIAALYKRAGEYDQALRWISDLIVRPGLPSTLKNKADDLKAEIRSFTN